MSAPNREDREIRILMTLLRILLFAAFFAAASTAGGAQTVNLLYSEKCASCHADDGSGHTAAAARMKVSDLRSKRIKQMTDDVLYAATAEGKTHQSYPHAFLHAGLTEPQIRDLIKYIRTFSNNQK